MRVSIQPEAGGEVGEVAGSRVPGLAAWGPFLRAEHVKSCCDRLGTAYEGVYLAARARATTCLLGNQNFIYVRLLTRAREVILGLFLGNASPHTQFGPGTKQHGAVQHA